MPPNINPQTHLLLSIPFSHYNEKARWAFAYYGIPFTHHLLLPCFHVFSVKQATERPTSASVKQTNARVSPYSTPLLIIYGDDLTGVQDLLQDSHDILRYLSAHFSTPARVNLYESCGIAQEDRVNALEKHYDEVLGRAARDYVYYDMLVLNKWRALLPFAVVGFTNRVGIFQSMLWFVLSPLLGPLIISSMKHSAEKHKAAMQTCRVEVEDASRCKYKHHEGGPLARPSSTAQHGQLIDHILPVLQKSPYLAGEELSAADITFAALSYPVLGVTHEVDYQQYPPSSSAFSSQGKDFQKELRATRAGQHVLWLFKERRWFEAPLPLQKRTLWGAW